MPKFNQADIAQLRHDDLTLAERKRLELYPDTIPYDYTEDEYTRLWEKLNNAKRGHYFYTDGYKVKRVSYARSLWEQFRGFFGFTNRCQPQRVKMTLQKIAYFGYIKGYDQTPLDNIPNWGVKSYRLNELFRINVSKSKNRTNTNTENLQNHLAHYYLENQAFLFPNFWQKLFSGKRIQLREFNYNSHFGNTQLNKKELLINIIKLDPQNNDFIKSLLTQIDNHPASQKHIIKNSKLADRYAEHRLNRFTEKKIPWEELQETCNTLDYKFSNTKDNTKSVEHLIKCNDFEKFILPDSPLAIECAKKLLGNYLSEVESYINKFLSILGLESAPTKLLEIAKALDSTLESRMPCVYIELYLKTKLIEEAASLISKLEDLPKAVSYIRDNNINLDIVSIYVNKDSELGHALAESYMDKIKNQLFNDKDDSQKAEQFASHAYLQGRYPQYYFRKYIFERKFDEAYTIYASVTDKASLDSFSIETMAEFYHQRGKEYKQESKQLMLDHEWQKAEAIMQQSSHAKKLAHIINPDHDEYKASANRRGYAVAKLIVNSPLYGDQRVSRLETALKKLESAYDKNDNDPKIKATLMNALQERAKLAVNASLTEVEMNNGVHCDESHKKSVLSHVERAIACYERITQLDPAGEQPLLTAEAHFMLADLRNYFDIDKNPEHYRRAMELMPNNPFYVTRCSEVIDRNLQDQGRLLLRNNSLGASDYMQWFEQRWMNPAKRSCNIDCHQFNKPKVGWGAWLTSFVY